jgi:acyl carrier protein
MPHVSVEELKRLLVENCVLKVNLDEISADTPLFGPNSVGLDSLDALQMTVAIEQNYGLVIADSQTARQVLQSLGSLRDWIANPPAPQIDGTATPAEA